MLRLLMPCKEFQIIRVSRKMFKHDFIDFGFYDGFIAKQPNSPIDLQFILGVD